MPQAFSIPIERVVNLLKLERDPKGAAGATSFNVHCPFCDTSDSKKYHMNINTVKNTYSCLRCSAGRKGTGALDLYGRVALDEPMTTGANGNSKKLYKSLCEALDLHDARANADKPRQEIKDITPASDENLNKAYSTLLRLKCFALSDAHRNNLKERGLSDAAIKRNRYRSIGNNFEWLKRYHLFKELNRFYDTASLSKVCADNPILKKYSREQIVAGLVVAGSLIEYGCDLNGVPGFFTLCGKWCFRYDYGMIVPTRNAGGRIVALQLRRDKGKLRYMTVSSKGLPNGVTVGISRAHFPLGNAKLNSATTVLLTEGPLKADVAVELMGGKTAFVALHGVNNQKELPQIFAFLKSKGVKKILNAFDMDKITNPNVGKASVQLKRVCEKQGLSISSLCWDRDFALKKEQELADICSMNGMEVPETDDVFVAIGKMSHMLHEAGKIERGSEVYDWFKDTKGIDDFLKNKKQA